jgi:hypothetical protein
MSAESNYLSVYGRTGQMIDALLRGEPSGAILSIDIGGSFFDLIARELARSNGYQLFHSPALTRHRADMLARSSPITPQRVIAESPLFGGVDGSLCLVDDLVAVESYSRRFEVLSTRTIDSWSRQHSTIEYIHFGDPLLVLDQLAGAEETLARDRPVVTLYPAGVNRSELYLCLEHYGYKTLDLNARSVLANTMDVRAGFGWIAIPAEKQSDAIAKLGDRKLTTFSDNDFTEWQHVMDLNSAQNRRLSRAELGPPAGMPPVVQIIEAGEIIAAHDCYPAESDGVRTWRWLGPRPRSRLAVPCAMPGVYQVEFRIMASLLQGGLKGYRVFVEGREVEAIVNGTSDGTIRFTGRIDARDYAGYMTIDLVSLEEASHIQGESRLLRMNLESIAVSSCH